MARTDPQIRIRLPQEVLDNLSLSADRGGRSINAEIVRRLEMTIDRDESVASVAVEDRFQRVTLLIKIDREAIADAEEEMASINERLKSCGAGPEKAALWVRLLQAEENLLSLKSRLDRSLKRLELY